MSHASCFSLCCYLFEATREGFGSVSTRGLMCPSSPYLKQYQGFGLLLLLAFASGLCNYDFWGTGVSPADFAMAGLGIIGLAAGLIEVFRLSLCVTRVS